MQQSVLWLSILMSGLSVLIAIGVPIALTVWCSRRHKGAFHAVLVGLACFFLGALVLEQFCHTLVFTLIPNIRQMPVLYCIYGCLAAGLFEETARLIGLRILCKSDNAPMIGFAYGVGHGGFEALYIGFAGLLSNLLTLLMMYTGQADQMLSSLSGEQLATAQAQLDALSATTPIAFLAGGVERLIAICFHLAMSMLIWMVVTKRLPAWGYALAVALHALCDVFAMLYQTGYLTNVWAVEGLTFLYTAVVCCGVFRVLKEKGAALPIRS
ncbi:MAG: YhfC family intramembrane metalloprotease [Gemmiger sp.]